MKTSICVIAPGRGEGCDYELANLVRGLNRNCRPPGELIVLATGEARHKLPASSYPIRQLMFGEEPASPGAVYGIAAAEAQGDLLIFLNSHSIPHHTLVRDYAVAAGFNEGVLMGELCYLPVSRIAPEIDYAALDGLAVPRAGVGGQPQGMVRRCEDPRQFGTDNFAVPARTLRRLSPIAGEYSADPSQIFASAIAAQEIPLWWVRGGKAYLQFPSELAEATGDLGARAEEDRLLEPEWGAYTPPALRFMGPLEGGQPMATGGASAPPPAAPARDEQRAAGPYPRPAAAAPAAYIS